MTPGARPHRNVAQYGLAGIVHCHKIEYGITEHQSATVAATAPNNAFGTERP